MSTEVSMQMHISTPKLPNACAMQCILKSDNYFNSRSCEQDQTNSPGLRDRSDHD
jgi:hypothetical protein